MGRELDDMEPLIYITIKLYVPYISMFYYLKLHTFSTI